jgi:hypothetical protein
MVQKIAAPTALGILITVLVPVFMLFYGQCSRSVAFWYGSGSRSGSLDQYTWLMDRDRDPDMAPAPDLDLDPALFVTDSQDAKKQTNFSLQISCILLSEGTSKSSKITFIEESLYSRNQGFSSCFCLLMEGSGSRRPKNIRILIRNIAYGATTYRN